MKKKSQEPYAGVFAGLEFPAYKYEHFPLLLTKGAGKKSEDQLVVNDQAELDAALAEVLEDGETKVGWKEPARVGAPISLTEKEHKVLTDTISAKDRELEAMRAQLAELQKPPAAKPAAPAKP